MEFSFDFVTDMFGSFYAFFMRIACFLKYTPNDIVEWFNLVGHFQYGFENVFTGASVIVQFRQTELVEWFLRYLNLVGLGDIPIYQGFLVQASTVWLFIIVVRVFKGLVS